MIDNSLSIRQSLRFSDNLPFGVLNLGSDIINRGGRLGCKSNRFSSQCLHKYLLRESKME